MHDDTARPQQLNAARYVTGIGAFLDVEQQRAWVQGKAWLVDAAERLDQPEQRLKYLARYERLQRMPQVRAVLDLIGRYGRDFIPIPRRTERYWWSVSCLPATPGKALVRVKRTDDVKNSSDIWAVARVLVKLALQDDQPSQR